MSLLIEESPPSKNWKPEDFEDTVARMFQALDEWTPKLKRGENFSMIISGSRGCGKSTIVKDMLKKLRKQYDNIIVFTLTKDEFYSDIEDIIIFNSFDEATLAAIIQTAEEDFQGEEPRYTLIIFDDCIPKKIRWSDSVQELFTRGRHFCSVIYSIQDIKLVTPCHRDNCTYMIIGKTNSSSRRKEIADEYFSACEQPLITPSQYPPLMWQTYIQHMCKDYRFLVIDKEKVYILKV